jgi:hypothetical protein
MDRRERQSDFNEILKSSFESGQSELHTAIPGIVQSFNPATMTAVVQPSITVEIRQADGSKKEMVLPVLTDCPVVFPSGGGFILSFPIKAGDNCLVVFAERCIDGWWQNGGVSRQVEKRMHDLSDGFVLVGCFAQTGIPSITQNKTSLKALDGSAEVIMDNDTLDMKIGENSTIKMSATQIEIDAPIVRINHMTLNKALETSTITGSASIDGIIFGTHKHTNVQSGGDSSGGPING